MWSTEGHKWACLWRWNQALMPWGSLATHGYRAEVSSNPSLELRGRGSRVRSLISNAQPA